METEQQLCTIDEDLRQYQCVLLSGCACIGISHLGFLCVLQKLKKLRFLKYFCGTSIGSIVALLFLLKISIDDIYKAFSNYRMIDLLEISVSTQRKQSIASTGFVIAHLIDILMIFHKSPDITFQQLYKETGVILVITASKLESDNFVPEYFSYPQYGDMKIIDAINASICIPFVFPSVRVGENTYIDGALVDDLPFAYMHKQYNIAYGDMIAHSPKTIPQSETKTIEQSWFDLTINILNYTRNELHKYRGKTERTVFTSLHGGGILDLHTNRKTLLYYFHKAIQTTNQFIYDSNRNIIRRRSDTFSI